MVRIPCIAVVLSACGGSADPPASSCDPARGPEMARFADVTAASGVDFQYMTSGFQGGGLGVVDLDGDGLPELVAGSRDGGTALWKNLGGLRFEFVPVAFDPGPVTALAVADLDNDGDRDLIAAGGGVARVIANEGGLAFREVGRLAGSGTTEHVLPVDLDGDGLLDLYFSNYDIRVDAASQNRLYVNRGGLAFEPAGTVGAGLSWTATALDLEGDGDQDLYIANDTLIADFGKPDHDPTVFWPVDLMLRNDGVGTDGIPRFTDVANELGLAAPRSSMGGTLGDFDEDGRIDLFIPDFGAKKLFLRDGAGGFVERAAELGVSAISRRNALCAPDATAQDCLVLSWSAVLADFDLDGYDEILIVNGETSPGNTPPVVMLTRGAELPYRELSPDMPCMDARGLVATDLDADGDPDVVLGHREGPLAIYENRGLPAGGWLGITLRGQPSNRDGVGAVVTLRLASGRTLTRVVGAGGVIHTASPAEAHFGFGDDAAVAITVRWPSGRTSELVAPATETLLVVTE